LVIGRRGECFRRITFTYYQGKFCQVKIGAHGIMIVYDITDRCSLFSVDHWMKEVKSHSSEWSIKMLIGNKCDEETRREVTYEEGKKMASKYDMLFLETSPKTSYNVDKAFMLLVKKVIDEVKLGSLCPILPRNETTRAVSKPAGQDLFSGCICF